MLPARHVGKSHDDVIVHAPSVGVVSAKDCTVVGTLTGFASVALPVAANGRIGRLQLQTRSLRLQGHRCLYRSNQQTRQRRHQSSWCSMAGKSLQRDVMALEADRLTADQTMSLVHCMIILDPVSITRHRRPGVQCQMRRRR